MCLLRGTDWIFKTNPGCLRLHIYQNEWSQPENLKNSKFILSTFCLFLGCAAAMISGVPTQPMKMRDVKIFYFTVNPK